MKATQKNQPEILILTHSRYTITFDAIKPPFRVPREIQENQERLYELLHANPIRAVQEVEELLRRHPGHPLLLNFLSNAYNLIDRWDQAEKVIHENYQKNPTYLFARCAYAQLCMAEENFDEIPKIFKNQFEISCAYPDRKVFHLTEFVTFNATLAEYFYHIGNIEQATLFHKSIQDIAPHHPLVKRVNKLQGTAVYCKQLFSKMQQMVKNAFINIKLK